MVFAAIPPTFPRHKPTLDLPFQAAFVVRGVGIPAQVCPRAVPRTHAKMSYIVHGPSVGRRPEASPSVSAIPQTTTGTNIRFADSLEQSRLHVRQKPVHSAPVSPRQPVAQPVVRVP